MNAGKSLNLEVGATHKGITLIEFLSNRLGISRNKAKEIIDQRRVFVNGRRVWMARHRLKSGDQITGYFSAEKAADIKNANILYEDNDYLIVNKPAGRLSNGPDSVEQLLNRQSGNESAAAYHAPQVACHEPRVACHEPRVACHEPRVACHEPRVACHRLDKDTSGCLIFAKSVKAKERIITLFARNEIAKKYEAIVRGRLPKETMTIATPIEGQKAISHIRLLDATPAASPAGSGASHVSISIETGRTHQIRKHLASIGHPVLGDRHYGIGREVPQSERLIGRQMLHAVEIKFSQPFSGLPVHGKASLPPDIKDCLRKYHLK